MKRIGFLFEKAFTRESLYQAYIDARRGKRKKYYCFRFETNLAANLESLYQELHAGTYQPRPYKTFVVKEPKPRVIHAPAFRDMVVQHAIYRLVYPIFNRTFIDQSFACRVGKGTHKASQYAQKCLRSSDSDTYSLSLDIRKFFYSIDRSILRRQIERKIKDRRLIDLMMSFAEMQTDKGIPIGNLLSQIYALIFLNPLDHFIKRVLKVKKYFRYVDDFVLVGITRQQCLELREVIVRFLEKYLALSLSKSTIQKVKRGLNFVGYRTWKTKRFIRKYSLYKFRKCVKAGRAESAVSILGHAKHTNSLPYMFHILKEINNDSALPKVYQKVFRRIICDTQIHRAGLYG
jgi:RNA-directed DNA polymerase